MRINWKWAWDRFALMLPVGIFLLLLVNEWAALGVMLSLFNGEGFIGYWIDHGMSFVGATLIAVACSTFDITLWFRCLFWIRDAYGHARLIYDRLENQITVDRLNGEARWLRRIKRWGLQLYLSYVPQPPEYREAHTAYAAHIKQYAWLLFYGFTPTCIFSGVGYVVAFHLNPLIAFPLLASANAVKMICFGYWALHTPWQIIAVIIVVIVPRIRWLIERQNRRHTHTFAKSQSTRQT